MAGTNTEQPANKAEQKKKIQTSVNNKRLTVNESKAPVKTVKKIEVKNDTKDQPKKPVANSQQPVDKKVQSKIKKDSASAYGRSMPVSTKVAVAICKFIKNKTPKAAIKDLEEVAMLKIAIPMKGEIPHRKGRIMSGRFPQRAANDFLVIIKNLVSNADQNDMESPVIVEAIANKAQRPYGKGGRWKRKRTHVALVVKEKKINKQNNKNK